MSWAKLRRQVYARDQGICQACLLRVGKRWDAGHLVDRIAGGQDTLDNLVVMCLACNRTRKPITRTLQAANAWLEMCRWAARMGREAPIDWESMWALGSGRRPTDGTQALAEHECLE